MFVIRFVLLQKSNLIDIFVFIRVEHFCFALSTMTNAIGMSPASSPASSSSSSACSVFYLLLFVFTIFVYVIHIRSLSDIFIDRTVWLLCILFFSVSSPFYSQCDE